MASGVFPDGLLHLNDCPGSAASASGEYRREIDFSGSAPFRNGDRKMAGAGEDGRLRAAPEAVLIGPVEERCLTEPPTRRASSDQRSTVGIGSMRHGGRRAPRRTMTTDARNVRAQPMRAPVRRCRNLPKEAKHFEYRSPFNHVAFRLTTAGRRGSALPDELQHHEAIGKLS
jgi:hypothetical protein